jgi:tetratricopeptide (TPR) repeat protein
VTFATLALNWFLGDDTPFGYHLFNLLLHGGVTLLLFLVLQELLGTAPEAKTVAFAAALLYAVHPIHTEAVAWAVGRAELLAAGFLFAGWLLHLRDRPIPSLACFALALLSKESAVAFFPLVLLGDYAIGKWKSGIRYALQAGLTLSYLGLLWKVTGNRFGPPGVSMIDNPLVDLTGGWRVLNALRVAWKYVALQIYPAVLSCDYSFSQIPVFRDWRHTLPAAIATAVLVAIWMWALWTRKTAWAITGAIYFPGFAVTANILARTGTIMGERLAYLPSAGFCLMLALAWNWLRMKRETAAWAVLAVVVLAFSVRTVVRNRDWKDPLALYTSAVRAVPNDAKMHASLAGQYLIRKQLDLAAREYQIALRIIPDYPDALSPFALLEFERGNYQAAGTLMKKALDLSDRNNLNYDFMMVLYSGILMKSNRPDEAFSYLNREITESPQYGPGWSTRAELHVERGELTSGRADAEMGLRLNPNDPQAQHILQRLNASVASPAK